MNVLHVVVITSGSHLSKSYHNVVMQLLSGRRHFSLETWSNPKSKVSFEVC